MAEHCVVIFARDDELSQLVESSRTAYKCIPVASGYEAAAELLAEPALAMVVDLSVLTAGHAKLLDIARDCGVEILGVGSFPAGLSAGDLAGIQLVSVDQIAAALAGLAKRGPTGQVDRRPVRLAPAKPADIQVTTKAAAPLKTGGANLDG